MPNRLKTLFFFSIIAFTFLKAQTEEPKQLIGVNFEDTLSVSGSLYIPYSENDELFLFAKKQYYYNSSTNQINLVQYRNNNIISEAKKELISADGLIHNLNAVVTKENITVISYYLNNTLYVDRIDTVLFRILRLNNSSKIENASGGRMFYSKEKDSVYLTYSKIYNNEPSGVYYRRLNSLGYGFNIETEVIDSQLNSAKNPSLIITEKNWLIAFENQNNNIALIKSEDGINWSDPVEITKSELIEKNPQMIIDSLGKLMIVYEIEKPHPSSEVSQTDIAFIASEDEGETWNDPKDLTTYYGNDKDLSIVKTNYKTGVSFLSNRMQTNNKIYKPWYGTLDKIKDTFEAPYLFKYTFEIDSINNKFNITAYADDNDLESVYLSYSKNYVGTNLVLMQDDGNAENGDAVAGDKIFSIIIPRDIKEFDVFDFSFVLTDLSGDTVKYPGERSVYIPYKNKSYFIDVNNIKFPVSINGYFASMRNEDGTSGATYEGQNLIFSGGFYLSGVTNGKVWTNAVAPADLVEDYLPGKFNGIQDDPRNNIYVVSADDEPFGENWRFWTKAVELGADFYDGDKDGIYDPVDKNNNGIWDPDEDKPVILGNVTTWNVFNDSKPSSLRRFSDVSPQGIEIQRTVFASRGSNYEAMKNMFFIKYKIINTGFVAEKLDSVYFGAWQDPDLGDPSNDFLATDTLLNSVITYDSENDEEFGTNPPALFTTLLQGPAEFIEDETFTDNNNNGIFDLGVDTPLDTAFYFDQSDFSKKEIIGAINISPSSSTKFFPGGPTMPVPESYQVRNLMLGYNENGELIDPCTFQYGKVEGVNCSSVNPRFIFSGDPVTNIGWLDTTAIDIRNMLNVGPFTLEKDKPVELIVAYVAGRGSDNLNSITLAREYVKEAFNVYQNNFTNLPTSVGSDKNITPKEFVLNQNYPNPFNPSTAITYQLSAQSKVELKVFDILGREVSTLVNEIQNAGSYKVNFNASKLSSGIYIYQIKADNFIQSKKMMLVK